MTRVRNGRLDAMKIKAIVTAAVIREKLHERFAEQIEFANLGAIGALIDFALALC